MRIAGIHLLAIARQGGTLPSDFENVAAYEEHSNDHNRSGSTGTHLHRQCRGVARGWLGWRLPRRWFLRGRLGVGLRRVWLGCGLWRLWLGGFVGLGRAGLLRRLWVLRIRAGLRRPGLLRTCLRHRDLLDSSLHECGLHETGLRNSRLREDAGLCCGTPCHLYCPDVCQGYKPACADGCSRHLRPGPSCACLDAAARPRSGSDLQLDNSAQHDAAEPDSAKHERLLRRCPVAGEAIVPGLVPPPGAALSENASSGIYSGVLDHSWESYCGLLMKASDRWLAPWVFSTTYGVKTPQNCPHVSRLGYEAAAWQST